MKMRIGAFYKLKPEELKLEDGDLSFHYRRGKFPQIWSTDIPDTSPNTQIPRMAAIKPGGNSFKYIHPGNESNLGIFEYTDAKGRVGVLSFFLDVFLPISNYTLYEI